MDHDCWSDWYLITRVFLVWSHSPAPVIRCVQIIDAVVLMLRECGVNSYRITAVSPCLMVMLSVDLWLSTLITGSPVGIKHSSRKKLACSCRNDTRLHTNISTDNKSTDRKKRDAVNRSREIRYWSARGAGETAILPARFSRALAHRARAASLPFFALALCCPLHGSPVIGCHDNSSTTAFPCTTKRAKLATTNVNARALPRSECILFTECFFHKHHLHQKPNHVCHQQESQQ